MRAIIPPSKFVMLGTEANGEVWLEYQLSNPEHIKHSPTPMIMHPVQIKDIVRNDTCPIVRALQRWFYPLTNQIIYQESVRIGRFLQAAYN